jgi:ABC-2 type transport system ATP-binding protein
MMTIEVHDLVKRFGPIIAVDGISFQVPPGEFFGFLGPNGAGKTTTIHILCTLLKPTSGRALINGYDCATEAQKVRRCIGLVFQETTLDKDLTMYENLFFSCYLQGMKKRIAENRIGELLGRFGLSDRKDELVKRLSGGMKRVLDIARGILHRPKILFLDEPTIGLDPQARLRIWNLLDELRQKEEMTIFLTTHYIEEAEGCDRVAIMDHGKTIVLGRPSELKQMIKGEVIQIRTASDDHLEHDVERVLKLPVARTEEGLFFAVESGEGILRLLYQHFGQRIISANINRPSLNDVFLHLTGREIR